MSVSLSCRSAHVSDAWSSRSLRSTKSSTSGSFPRIALMSVSPSIYARLAAAREEVVCNQWSAVINETNTSSAGSLLQKILSLPFFPVLAEDRGSSSFSYLIFFFFSTRKGGAKRKIQNTVSVLQISLHSKK